MSRWPSCCAPGNAGSNTAADHIEATRLALAQLPRHLRRRVLIRTDSGGGTHEFLAWLTRPGRRLAYSVGFTITDDVQEAILKIPDRAGPCLRRRWPGPARRLGRRDHRHAGPGRLAEGDAGHRPQGTPHPGAQLRFTDIDGHRFTCFATSTKGGQLADLELRHRRRARCEDRIRCAKDTGLRNLPCTATPRTRSGARSSRWPANCSPGCRCSPSTAPPAAGNPNGCGCGSSPAPGASSAAAAASGSASPPAGHGPARSHTAITRLQTLAPG